MGVNLIGMVYTNDLMGRILNVTLSDGTGISYDYDEIHLKSISRVNENGGCLFRPGGPAQYRQAVTDPLSHIYS